MKSQTTLDFLTHFSSLTTTPTTSDQKQQQFSALSVELALWKRLELKEGNSVPNIVYDYELFSFDDNDDESRERIVGGLIDELLLVTSSAREEESMDEIREKRLGVVLAIVHRLRIDRLIELIKRKDTPLMIIDLIVKNLRVLNVDQFFKLFDEEYGLLSDHVRIRMERFVRKSRPGWIPLVLDVLIKNQAPVRECLHMLGHLESGKHDELIVKVLKDLNLELKELVYGPLFRKHGNALSKYLKERLDELSAINYDRTAQYLSSQKILRFLLDNSPHLAWELISNYLINPFLEHQQPPKYLSQVSTSSAFYAHSSFVDFALKFIPTARDRVIIPSTMALQLTIKQTAKVLLAMIENFGYSRSLRSSLFIENFTIFTKPKQFENREILFDNMYSFGLKKEKFADWIFNNSTIDMLPTILNSVPSDIASIVVEKLYQIRKKKLFNNVSEESAYWKYCFNLEDNEQRNQFKNACSNPSPDVRYLVLQHLIFCSLNSKKQVKETLEFVEVRLRNDDDVCKKFCIGERSLNTLLTIHLKEHQEIIFKILENVTRRVSGYSIESFYQSFLARYSNNVEISKAILTKIEKNGIGLRQRRRGTRGIRGREIITFNKTVHRELFGQFRDTLEEMARNGSFNLLNTFLGSIHNPLKHNYIKEFIVHIVEQVISENSDEDDTKLIELYLKSDPKNISQSVKTVLSKRPLAFRMPVVQRALLDKRNVADSELLSKVGFRMSTYSPLAWHPEVLSALRLAEYAPKQLLESFSTYYKDYLFKVCRTGEIGRFYMSIFSEFSERKQILKLLPKLLFERRMLDDMVEFIDEKILSDIPLDNIVPTHGRGRGRGRGRGGRGGRSTRDSEPVKPSSIELNVTDVAVKSLAKLLRTNSQYPLDHLDYILNNISSENVVYFYAALNRFSKFDCGFVSKFISILKEKFSLGPKENFTISIQKVFVSFFKNHTQFVGNNISTIEIADFLLYLWDLKLHKDVQVMIVGTAKKLVSKTDQFELFTKLERLFKDATSHDYQSVVEEFVRHTPTVNIRIGQEMFLLSLKTLSHHDATTQSKVWNIISNTVNSFDVKALTSSFDPMVLFHTYLIDALLSFDPLFKDSSVANIAITNISRGVMENTKETCELVLEKIVKPLLTQEKFIKLNEEYDIPVSSRLKLLAKSIATEISNNYISIQEETLHTIQSQLILPWIGMVESMEDKISHTCLISCVCNWTNKDSIIENSIKRIAKFFSDMPELKYAAMTTLCHNNDLFVLTKERSEGITQAVAHVLENHHQYSQEELVLAVSILKLMDSNQEIESLMKVVKGLISSNPLLGITYFIRKESDSSKPYTRFGYGGRRFVPYQ